MGFRAFVKLDLPMPQEVIRAVGADTNGALQKFHTQNVLNRIQKYMPYRSGAMIKLTIAQTNVNQPRIVTHAPQAAMLYYGKVMVDPLTGVAGFYNAKTDSWYSRKGCVKVVTERNLNFLKEKNQKAGAFWDKALIANEGKALVNDLQKYIDKRG